MEYKTKGKEGTNVKGQKKETKLGRVNKKRGNDAKRPGKEKKDKADDISNSFPNFSVLNKEEKLAFFEALSAARKNIEKRGLPARERFGTVHDEYLQYFTRDDKGETVQKKPESAPSGRPRRSPDPSRQSPKESKFSTPESPKQRLSRPPGPASQPKKAAKPPQKNLRPESEPNDFCESVIKRDTDQMIQMYLNKKRRIEEQWKKSSQVSQSPPATVKAKNREGTRPPSGRVVNRKEDTRAKAPSKPVDTSNTPQIQPYNSTERKDFIRILKEAHTNILLKNPQHKDDSLTLEEVLKPYKGGGGRATTACPPTQDLHSGKQQQKNLRVKVTLTSGDNKRLCRTKSQVLNDSGKEGSGGKSKSLESVVCPDTPRGKQSKIPILRKAPQERNDRNDIKKETQPVKKIACEDLSADEAPKAAEARKTEAPIKRKPLTIKEKPEKKEEKKIVAKEKKKDKRRDKKAKQMSKECEEDTGDAAGNLAKTKAELKKVRKEKEKVLAESAKKEKELLRKKRKQEWRKRHQKKEALKKGASKDEDCTELKMVGVRLFREECLEEEEKEHLEKKSECEKEELTAEKKNLEKENKCEEKESPRMRTNQDKKDESEEMISSGKQYQKRDCPQEEQEEKKEDEEHEKDEEEDQEEECDESFSSAEEECPCQQSSECQAVAENCQQQPASDSSHSSVCEDESGPEHHRVSSYQACSEHVVKAATQSTKSLAGVSLVEKRPEETWQAQEIAPTYTTGKVIVVDDNVIKRIKDLIEYLEKKVNPKDNLQSEYVRLILSYTEYLTKVTESLILAKKPKKGQQVQRTYAAPEVHLKFEDKGDEAPKEVQKKGRIPHSISEDEFQHQMLPGPSGIEKKEDSRRKKSGYDFGMLSESESSSNSEEENLTLIPSAFKKTRIPMTKIRLLQDLLKGRAKFAEGSIDDFKIVHIPEEAEYVPPEKPLKEEAKEISEADVDQGQKTVGMKFLRNLAKLCNCGKKQLEEDAILENLKGEAVRVDTVEAKKDPTSATINDSTMEVLKAAERKKIIEKYLKREMS